MGWRCWRAQACAKTSTITEPYASAALDSKIDDKEFVLPK
jgi:hypothetical protein